MHFVTVSDWSKYITQDHHEQLYTNKENCHPLRQVGGNRCQRESFYLCIEKRSSILSSSPASPPFTLPIELKSHFNATVQVVAELLRNFNILRCGRLKIQPLLVILSAGYYKVHPPFAPVNIHSMSSFSMTFNDRSFPSVSKTSRC